MSSENNTSNSATSPGAIMSPMQHQHHDLQDPHDTWARYLAYLSRVKIIAIKKLALGVRYSAYTSDVGEAFRPITSPWIVRGAYAISWSYVTADVSIAAYKEYEMGSDTTDITRTAVKQTLFNSIASMGLPAVTIHTAVHAAQKVFTRVGKYQKWGPTVCGLGIIPALPYMFDEPVEYALDTGFDAVWPRHRQLTEEEKHHH
eukprot:PhM_4_TR11905/c0_g1_i1/m.27170/K17981/MTFP1, MTP18; mitochondrial fission process protein 1